MLSVSVDVQWMVQQGCGLFSNLHLEYNFTEALQEINDYHSRKYKSSTTIVAIEDRVDVRINTSKIKVMVNLQNPQKIHQVVLECTRDHLIKIQHPLLVCHIYDVYSFVVRIGAINKLRSVRIVDISAGVSWTYHITYKSQKNTV